MAQAQPLRLLAQDEDDLKVVSACLQDALTSVGEISYEPRRRRFAVLAHRFRWEASGDARTGGERVRAALHFDFVDRVRSRGIARDDTRGLLPLLAVTATPRDDGVTISLQFGGGGVIDLDAECVDCQLNDLGAPWRTERRPDHDLDSST
ncbi:MAG: DUF2948 family protein [Alphaproteobacteria bacterium]